MSEVATSQLSLKPSGILLLLILLTSKQLLTSLYHFDSKYFPDVFKDIQDNDLQPLNSYATPSFPQLVPTICGEIMSSLRCLTGQMFPIHSSQFSLCVMRK